MGSFKLSASLEGHEDDVRDVTFPNVSSVLSASRDATVRLWKSTESSPQVFDGSIVSHGTAFVNTVAFVSPSQDYPNGLVVAGGKDTVIEVRDPAKPPEANAERLLIGHAHNVCALDISPDQRWIVSGSWDASAIVWSIGKWDKKCVLEGHESSVWSVLAYDNETIITASADKLIRIFTFTGKLISTIHGNNDIVRALCKLPKNHPSGADFASAGNDGVIRLWQTGGSQVGALYGHENFIYSLACLRSGELISSGEDRTVRIWKDDKCVQTITHPAISVWCVAVCEETGDIASGASDRIVRIFTRSEERQASFEVANAFEESVKSSSIPQQQVGEINKEKLPGPEFLTQKSGTKEGQVVMIRETNGSITAHTWSTAANQWMSVGTVVDAVGSSGKKSGYLGKDYDYVFDVDIEDGKPPLKLPYNLSQNPYEAATKFLEDNNLPVTYLDQVANFITTNTQGATIGQTYQPQVAGSGSDPWGSESRYRPGEQTQPTSEPSSQQSHQRQNILPQTQYLSIRAANIKMIQKKIEELNEQLISGGSKKESLNPSQLESLRGLTSRLDMEPKSITILDDLDTVFHIITSWPSQNRLPGFDLLRLITAATPAAASQKILSVLSESGVFTDVARPNNQMLAMRALANLFETPEGQQLADENFNQIHQLVHNCADGPSNRNLIIAMATLYINLAVLLTNETHKDSSTSADRALTLMEDLSKILSREKDSEGVYRALVALGTLLALGEDVQSAAREVYGIENTLTEALSGIQEPRMRSIVREIRQLLA